MGPWHAVLATDPALLGSQQALVAGSGAGYALSDGTLARFEPASDSAGATTSVAALGSAPVVAAAGGTVWIAALAPDHASVRVREVDPSDLSATAELTVPVGGNPQTVAIAVDPDGSSVFVGAGDTVATVDVKRASVTGRFTVSPGRVGALAVTADGDLYLAVDSDSGTVALQRRVATTGAVVSSDPYGNWIDQIVPTKGGLWLSSHAGTEATVQFYPSGDLADTSVRQIVSASSPRPTVSIVEGVALIGTSNELACADPDTGAVLDQAQSSNTVSYSDISQVGGHLVADFFSNDGQGVATFDLPSGCTR